MISNSNSRGTVGLQFGGNQEIVMWFGQLLLQHFAPDGKQYTVAEWIDHVLESKGSAGRKRKTLNGYRYCAIRVKELIGNRLLAEIRPSDISDLFVALKNETSRYEVKAKLKKGIDLNQLLQDRGLSQTRLAKQAHISQSTVDRAVNGLHILLSKAQAIAAVLGRDPGQLFTELENQKKLSATTLYNYRQFVSLVFSAAVRELQIPFNPVERVEKARRPRHRAESLQLEDVQAVWAAAEQEPIDRRCLIHLFLITGGRRGEIAGLRWSRLSWEKQSITIDHEILYTPEDGVYFEDSTKTEMDRILRLPKETMDLLAEYRLWQIQRKAELGDRWIESDYIFTGRYGGAIPPDSISGYLDRFEERYKLPHLHPHKFRHTMASILIYSGMDPVTVSKRLGHASVSTTENIYAHLIRRADVESAECIADAIIRGQK